MAPKIHVFHTPEGMLDKVVKKFGKDRKSFNEDVASLEKWIENQPHLPELLDSQAIGNFLLMNKCDIEKTKEKIDMYYTVRTKLDSIYSDINPKLPNMKKLSDIIYLSGQPVLTEKMYRVAFFKIHNPELADDWHPRDFVRVLANIQEVRLREDIVYGDVFIIDCAGASINFVLKMTPTMLYESIHLVYQKVYNLRVKGVYLVNLPPYGQSALALIKKIVKPKIAQRIHICKDLDALKKHFPSNWLPTDFGGEGPSLKELNDLAKVKFEEYQELFDELDRIKIDDSRRPEQLNDEFLGFYGNFKKLDID